MSVCVFIRPTGRHTVLLQCANMYAGTGHSNTKYNVFGLGSLKDTLFRFAIINTGLLTPNFACNVLEYFEGDRPKLTYQSQNVLV